MSRVAAPASSLAALVGARRVLGFDAALPQRGHGAVVAGDRPTTAADVPPTCADREASRPSQTYPPLDPLPAPGAMPDGTDDGGHPRPGPADRRRLRRHAAVRRAQPVDRADRGLRHRHAEGGRRGRSSARTATERIEYRVITYADRLPSLESGDVDIVAHTMTINCNRWLRIAFSSEYFARRPEGAGQDGLAASTRIDAARRRRGHGLRARGQHEHRRDAQRRRSTDGLVVLGKADISDCLVAMQQGEADATTGDDTVLAGFAAQDPNTEVVGEPFTEEPYGLGFNEDDVDLVQFVNAVLERDPRRRSLGARSYQTWLLDTDALRRGRPPRHRRRLHEAAAVVSTAHRRRRCSPSGTSGCARCTDRLFDLDARIAAERRRRRRARRRRGVRRRKAIAERVEAMRAASAQTRRRRWRSPGSRWSTSTARRSAATCRRPHAASTRSSIASSARSTRDDASAGELVADARSIATVAGRRRAPGRASSAQHVDAASPSCAPSSSGRRRDADALRDAGGRRRPRCAPSCEPIGDRARAAARRAAPALPDAVAAARERGARRCAPLVDAVPRQGARRCRTLAVPSVDALGGRSRRPAAGLPWPAARAAMQPYVLDRSTGSARALDEVERRFAAVLLQRRDELRGLLQAFRDKAGGSRPRRGPATSSRVYRRRASALWSAPCDLEPRRAARRRVHRSGERADRRRQSAVRPERPRGGSLMRCTQPGCTGTIVDGYCDVCGMAAAVPPSAAAQRRPASPASRRGARRPATRSPTGVGTRVSTVTNRLGLVPLGSARTRGRQPTDPPARRPRRGSSRLGAGLTRDRRRCPILDPRQALMDPPVVAEDKRFCSVCGSPVGRARDGSPGRTKGFCPKCRTPFDFDPKLAPGALARRAVRDRRLPRARRHGLDLPRPRPQRERPLGRASRGC